MTTRMEVEVMPQVKGDQTLFGYTVRVREFLAKHQLQLLMAWKDNQKCPPWAPHVPGLRGCRKCHRSHGDYYRVTIRHAGSEVVPLAERKLLPQPHAWSFDFWGSRLDHENHRRLSDHEIVATIAAEADCPTEPDAVIIALGLDPDNQDDFRHAIAAARFATRLRKFFTPQELKDLAEVLR